MHKSRCIMLQGTGSHVGKSVLAAALCRIFRQDGYKVVPFKSQNMALNSFVTATGGEMGRAQAVQAEAAGVVPSVLMNPILLKPTGQATSQVIVMGKAVGNMSATEYHERFNISAIETVEKALQTLREDNDVIVIEGAGSPAEVNLQKTEIVNMRIARMADCPVILVADIDKGGALAAVVGTLELLEPDDRSRVKGVIINKFRGDVSLFMPAVDFLENKTGVPVLGIIPYFNDLKIQEEDTVAENTASRKLPVNEKDQLDVVVVSLPHISNFTDFDAFDNEPDVRLRYVKKPEDFCDADLIIIPGSKNTIHDLFYLKQTGLASAIQELAKKGTPIIGICGGFQMLGSELHDPQFTESDISSVLGLGLLDVITTFEPEKITTQVLATPILPTSDLLAGIPVEPPLSGYEIHMGRTVLGKNVQPVFEITTRSGVAVSVVDGASNKSGSIFGTYIHGIFDNDAFRRGLLDKIRNTKGLEALGTQFLVSVIDQREKDYDRLAELVRSNLNLDKIAAFMSLSGK